MSPLRVERLGGITRCLLARPEKTNALDERLVEALLEAVARAHGDGTRLLVLEGEGRNFSAGFDFSGYEQASEGDLLHRFVRIEQLLQSVHHAPFATLGLAHGRNFGAGADLFVACSVRIAAEDATFRMPGLRFGVQLGTRRLAARIGNEPARAMLAESRTVDAAEAVALGLAHRVAARDDWPSLIDSEAERANALTPNAGARLAAATLADTRDRDMADLVASLVEPGLKERIRAYRAG